jgi:hypothetical protein
MAYGIHTVVHVMKTATPQPEIDRSPAESQGAKLGTGNDPVLT